MQMSPQAYPVGSTDPAEGHPGQHAITRTLGQGDDQQEAFERFAHDSGHQGQRVADDRQPTQQQGPMAVALVMVAGGLQMTRADGEPAAVLVMFQALAQPPVHQGAEDIAESGHGQQQPQVELAVEQQAHQHGFGLQRQQGGGTEGRQEQTEAGGEDQWAG